VSDEAGHIQVVAQKQSEGLKIQREATWSRIGQPSVGVNEIEEKGKETTDDDGSDNGKKKFANPEERTTLSKTRHSSWRLPPLRGGMLGIRGDANPFPRLREPPPQNFCIYTLSEK